MKFLSGNCSFVIGGLKAKAIKAASHIPSGPLAQVCDAILSTGTFPNKMKAARVCVIHKDGTCNNLSKYTPISLLPSFSKVAEHNKQPISSIF